MVGDEPGAAGRPGECSTAVSDASGMVHTAVRTNAPGAFGIVRAADTAGDADTSGVVCAADQRHWGG